MLHGRFLRAPCARLCPERRRHLAERFSQAPHEGTRGGGWCRSSHVGASASSNREIDQHRDNRAVLFCYTSADPRKIQHLSLVVRSSMGFGVGGFGTGVVCCRLGMQDYRDRPSCGRSRGCQKLFQRTPRRLVSPHVPKRFSHFASTDVQERCQFQGWRAQGRPLENTIFAQSASRHHIARTCASHAVPSTYPLLLLTLLGESIRRQRAPLRASPNPTSQDPNLLTGHPSNP